MAILEDLPNTAQCHIKTNDWLILICSKQDTQRADWIQGHRLSQGASLHIESYVLAYLAYSFGLTSFPSVHKSRAPVCSNKFVENPC